MLRDDVVERDEQPCEPYRCFSSLLICMPIIMSGSSEPLFSNSVNLALASSELLTASHSQWMLVCSSIHVVISLASKSRIVRV